MANGLRPFALPRPDSLSPLLNSPVLRRIIPHVRASLFWSVWPYRGGAKRSFATYVEEEFSEVRGSKHPASTRG
jgi:hypothetical protein